MANYFLTKEKKTNSIIYLEYDLDGYSFMPKNNKKYLDVQKIIIINPTLIDKILTIKFNVTFKKLAYMIMLLLESDDTTDGFIDIALDEISKTRGIVLNKYQKFLTKEKELLFLNKLRMLESQLRIKQIQINRFNYLENSEEINFGRGK